MRPGVRAGLALMLLAVAVPSGLYGYQILQRIWADYQDSSTSIYLLFGIPFVAVSVALTSARRPAGPRAALA